MSTELYVRAIAFQEGGTWVAQGIDYDIVAHAASLTALPTAFTRAVLENACVTTRLGREPMEGIRPAPEHYRLMFEEAAIEVRLIKDETPIGHRLPMPRVDVRLAEHAHAA
jgi:hypothetical protein